MTALLDNLSNKIQTAKESGYKENEILDYLGSQGGLQDKINIARDSGYKDTEIIDYLSKHEIGMESPVPSSKPMLIDDEEEKSESLYKAVPKAMLRSVGGTVEQLSRAARVLDPEGSIDLVRKFATKGVKIGEGVQKHFKSPPEQGFVKRGVIGGIESTLPSISAGIPGAVIGSIAGPVGTIGGYAASGSVITGLARYDKVLEEADKLGIPREISRSNAIKQAVVEGTFEGLSNLLDMLFLRMGKPVTASVKRWLMNTLKVAASEVPSEAATAGLQAKLNQDLGIPTLPPGEAIKESIIPTLTMSGGVSTVGTALRNFPRQKPKSEPEIKQPGKEEVPAEESTPPPPPSSPQAAEEAAPPTGMPTIRQPEKEEVPPFEIIPPDKLEGDVGYVAKRQRPKESYNSLQELAANYKITKEALKALDLTQPEEIFVRGVPYKLQSGGTEHYYYANDRHMLKPEQVAQEYVSDSPRYQWLMELKSRKEQLLAPYAWVRSNRPIDKEPTYEELVANIPPRKPPEESTPPEEKITLIDDETPTTEATPVVSEEINKVLSLDEARIQDLIIKGQGTVYRTSIKDFNNQWIPIGDFKTITEARNAIIPARKTQLKELRNKSSQPKVFTPPEEQPASEAAPVEFSKQVDEWKQMVKEGRITITELGKRVANLSEPETRITIQSNIGKLQKIVNDYNDGKSTIGDIIPQLESFDDKEITEAIDKYNNAEKSDRLEYGMRSGLPLEAENNLISLIEKKIARKSQLTPSEAAPAGKQPIGMPSVSITEGTKVRVGKSPQVYTITKVLEYTPEELELGEQYFEAKNDKTGEIVQNVPIIDIKPIKGKPSIVPLEAELLHDNAPVTKIEAKQIISQSQQDYSPKAIKQHKEYLFNQIDKAIQNAQDYETQILEKDYKGNIKIGSLDASLAKSKGDVGFVTIEVPGDGKFMIVNSKQALTKFKNDVVSKFPITKISNTQKIEKAPSGVVADKAAGIKNAMEGTYNNQAIHGNGEMILFTPLKIKPKSYRLDPSGNRVTMSARVDELIDKESPHYKVDDIVFFMQKADEAEGTSNIPLPHLKEDMAIAELYAGDKHTFIAQDKYNYIKAHYPDATFEIAGENKAVKIYSNKKLVGLVMPLELPSHAPTKGKREIVKPPIGTADAGGYTSTNLESFGFQSMYEKLVELAKSDKVDEGFEYIKTMAQSVYNNGSKVFKTFIHDMKLLLGNIFKYYQGAVVKAWDGIKREPSYKSLSELQNPITKGVAHFISPLSTLPNASEYLMMRGEAKGQVARNSSFVKYVRKSLRNLDDDTASLMYQVIDGQLDVDSLPEQYRRQAISLRNFNNRQGKMLVKRGAISPEAQKGMENRYIKYSYLKYLVNEQKGGGTGINVGALKGRADPVIKERIRGVEYVDKNVYEKLLGVAKELGVSHERAYKVGRTNIGQSSGSNIKSQFATELSVLAHELGHQLDSKYNMWNVIVKDAIGIGKRGKQTKSASSIERGDIQKELRALSDLTWEGSEVSDYLKQKARKSPEKMAHMLEAYIHAPEMFKESAPKAYAAFEKFIISKPELKPLTEIMQRISLKKLTSATYNVVSRGGKKYKSGLNLQEAISEKIKIEGTLATHRKEIGQITDIRIAMPISMSSGLQNIAAIDRFLKIVSKPEFIYEPSLVEVEGKKLGLFALKEELDTQRKVYEAMPNKDTKSRLNLLEDAYNEATEMSQNFPSDYEQIPDTKRFGSLRGVIIRKEIYRDIMPLFATDELKGVAGKTVNVLSKGVSGGMTLFKLSKVVFNLPAYPRNGISNIFQFNIKGTPLYEIPTWLYKSVSGLISQTPEHRRAFRSGLFQSNFSEGELKEIRQELQSMQSGNPSWYNIIGHMVNLSKYYGKIDDIFKFAIFLEETSKGSTEAEAINQAQKWGMDYSLVHPSVKLARRYVLPFATYFYKVTPLLVEAAAKRPWVIAKYSLVPYILAEAAKASLGLSDDEWKRAKRKLMALMKEGKMPLPLLTRSPEGNIQWIDVGAFIPGFNIYKVSLDISQGRLSDAIRDFGVSNPYADVYSVLQSARGDDPPIDPYTRKEIYNRYDTPSLKAFKTTEWLYNRWAPTMLTRQGALGWTFAIGEKDKKYGKTVTPAQGWARWFGVNINTSTPKQDAIAAYAKIREMEDSLKKGLLDNIDNPKKQKQMIENFRKELLKIKKQIE